MVTRTFRRVDLITQPLPPPSPEFGACPPLGLVRGGGGGGGGGGTGSGSGGGGFGGAKRAGGGGGGGAAKPKR
jgi:hypothetical protein